MRKHVEEIHASDAKGGERKTSKQSFFKRHGLSMMTGLILGLWILLYALSNEHTHWGSFFGNAIADWTGLVVMVLATKHLYERGSKESKEPGPLHSLRIPKALRDHSLTIFLFLTGLGWMLLFTKSDADSKWGQVVGNIVSEWTQILGLVLLTKKLIESGSKESH